MTMKKRLLAVLIAIGVVSFIAADGAQAQSAPLPLGTVSNVSQMNSCPSGFLGGMTCFQAEMSCPKTTSLGFIYGFEDPTGTPNGTIVLLDGGSGTNANGSEIYAEKYLESGFRVVEMVWDSGWEITGGTNAASIKTAACRPATFMNYVFQNFYRNGGMCAQGDSAGSGAIAYSLAWYGAANILDKVELLSGPVFGDIEQGCMVPPAATSTVCPADQLGCNGAPWPDSPAYVGPDIAAINTWSGNPTCNGRTQTSHAANASWKAMSIVDGTDNPSFSYPHTAMAGWLCSNVATEQNNSAAQGEFFYQQFTSSRQIAGYSVTRIDHCSGTEGVSDGVTPQGENGTIAIGQDMVSGCIKRHPLKH